MPQHAEVGIGCDRLVGRDGRRGGRGRSSQGLGCRTLICLTTPGRVIPAADGAVSACQVTSQYLPAGSEVHVFGNKHGVCGGDWQGKRQQHGQVSLIFVHVGRGGGVQGGIQREAGTLYIIIIT